MRKNNWIGLVMMIFLIFPLFNYANTLVPDAEKDKSYYVFSPDGKYLAKVYHTGSSTNVRIHETGDMRLLSEWQIPDFKAHTTRFSLKDPSKLLIADKKRLLVYRLIDDRKKLLFFQPKMKGQEIVQAYFNSDSDDIVWATKKFSINKHRKP